MGADPYNNPDHVDRLSVADVVAATGLSAGYIRQLARKGKFDGRQSDGDGRGQWSFDRSAVEIWITDRNNETQAHPGSGDQPWIQEMLLAETSSLRNDLLRLRLEQSDSEVERLRSEIEHLRLVMAAKMEVFHDAFARLANIERESLQQPKPG